MKNKIMISESQLAVFIARWRLSVPGGKIDVINKDRKYIFYMERISRISQKPIYGTSLPMLGSEEDLKFKKEYFVAFTRTEKRYKLLVSYVTTWILPLKTDTALAAIYKIYQDYFK